MKEKEREVILQWREEEGDKTEQQLEMEEEGEAVILKFKITLS